MTLDNISHCKIGAFIPPETGNVRERMDEWQKLSGRRPKMFTTFVPLKGQIMPEKDLRDITMLGSIPFIKVEAFCGLKDVISCKADKSIREFAKNLADLRSEVRISFGHEMNVEKDHVPEQKEWYPWQGDAGSYKRAYKRFVDVMRDEGAHNAKFVYNVNWTSVDLISKYFPGNNYVNCFAVDGYNWGPTHPDYRSKWMPLSDIISPAIVELKKLDNKLPVMIGEFASTEVGGDKSAWITEAFKYIKESGIDSAVWFNINKEQDWRVDSSPKSIEAFRQAISDPYFA